MGLWSIPQTQKSELKVILPTAFLPPVSYLGWMLQSEAPIIELHETFPKQTIRNRFEILTAQGRFRLSLPLEGRRNHTRTDEIRLSHDPLWPVKHWRSIVTAYSSAPYFEHYETEMYALVMQKERSLAAYNAKALSSILRMLKVEKEINYSADYIKHPQDLIDLRNFNISTSLPRYMQVFEETTGFQSDLCILDLIFNLGPSAKDYLYGIKLHN